MGFEQADRDILIATQTKVENMEEVLFSETGTARCATHTEKLSTIEKSLDKNGKWVKGIAIALSGSAFIVFLTILYDVVTAAP
jgi:hypothetical protein